MTVVESDLAIDRKFHKRRNRKKPVVSDSTTICTRVEVEMIASYRLVSVAKVSSSD
jgi:hypothetical protein